MLQETKQNFQYIHSKLKIMLKDKGIEPAQSQLKWFWIVKIKQFKLSSLWIQAVHRRTKVNKDLNSFKLHRRTNSITTITVSTLASPNNRSLRIWALITSTLTSTNRCNATKYKQMRSEWLFLNNTSNNTKCIKTISRLRREPSHPLIALLLSTS